MTYVHASSDLLSAWLLYTQKKPAHKVVPRVKNTNKVKVHSQFSPPKISNLSLLGYFSCLTLIYSCWHFRANLYMDAERGLGYILGIIGAAMMFSLILYPMRKKLRFMKRWGALKNWFRLHMILGIVGPIAIILHTNFKLGSINSKVTLAITLVVAASGFVGRYIYAKIHYGLYGRKIQFDELKSGMEIENNDIQKIINMSAPLKKQISYFKNSVETPSSNLFMSLARAASIDLRKKAVAVFIKFSLSGTIGKAAKKFNWEGNKQKQIYKETNQIISEYLTTAVRVNEFVVYERLFALWHILHLPLFIMLILTTTLHVVAVHLY